MPTTPTPLRLRDFNGDGVTEIAVYRPGTGTWYIKGQPSVRWGAPGDIRYPVTTTTTGPTTSRCSARRTVTGTSATQFVKHWGTAGDVPVPGSYSKLGLQLAVFRPSNGDWYVQGKATVHWGTQGDLPQPLNYNSSGLTGHRRVPSVQRRLVRRRLRAMRGSHYGTAGDIPVPHNYTTGGVRFAVFRPEQGQLVPAGSADRALGYLG